VADRARLAEQRITAAEQLTVLLLDSAIPDALHLARGVAQDEPLRERSDQLLMLALYRTRHGCGSSRPLRS
jgi:Bacterial transcriptional activator domain